MGKRFRVGDLVEARGEGMLRWFRVADLDVSGGRYRAAFLIAEDNGFAAGWKDFEQLTLASVALKNRLLELAEEVKQAKKDLRRVEKIEAKNRR